MSGRSDIYTVPQGDPGEGNSPSPTTLLHEVRVPSDVEIAYGRKVLTWISTFLVGLAVVALACDLMLLEFRWLPVHITRLLVSVALVVCLFRALTNVQYFVAILLLAATVISLGTLFWGVSRLHVPMIVFSAVGVVGYSAVCVVLFTSNSVRGYLGHRRAQRCNLAEDKERKRLQRMLMYESTRPRRRR